MRVVFVSTLLVSAPAASARMRVGIIDVKDPYTAQSGLGRLVKSSGHRAVDLTRALGRGRLPLEGLDALVLGSYCSSDARLRRGLSAQRDALASWIAAGHTVIVLAQEDGDTRGWQFLPQGIVLEWGNRDSDGLVPVDAGHRLLRRPNALPAERLLGWELRPVGGDKSVLLRGVHDAFRAVEGAAVIATADAEGRHPALVVGAHGAGRVIGLAVPVDKFFAAPREAEHAAAARSLLQNLLAFAETVVRSPDEAGTVPSGPPVRLRPVERRVRVFVDRDGDGAVDEGEPPLAGVLVGHGLARQRTNDAGEVSLRVDPADPQWVHVQLPSGWRARNGVFFAADDRPEPLDFPAGEDPESARAAFSVAQATDWHVGRRGIGSEAVDRMVAGFRDLLPSVPFVLATGDLTQRGTREEVAAWVEHVSRSAVPVLPVMGNHDASRGPERGRFYRELVGPVFYGYEYGGVHFTIAYVSTRGTPEMAWIRADLEESGLPSVLVLHHLPRTSFLDALAGLPVIAVVHGHWHGNRAFSRAGVPVVSTSSVLMAGWDHAPASFRLLGFAAGRLASSELRYTGARRLARIAVPTEGETTSVRTVVVQAHDASRPPVEGRLRVLESDGTARLERPLRSRSALAWTADLGALAPGDYILEATLVDGAGDAWPVERRRVRYAPVEPSDASARTGVWPTYRHDTSRSGTTRAALRPPLALSWVASLGGAVHHASPVVDTERVYVAVEDRAAIGPPRASGIVALDRRSGAVLWRHHTVSSVRQSPTVARGRLYYQEENGDVAALNAQTGELLWAIDLDEIAPPRYGAHWASCAPLVHRTLLVACYHRHPVVLDTREGRLLATLRAQGREDAFTLGSAALRRGTLVHGGLFSGVSGYRLASDGEAHHVWRKRGGGLYATPVVTSRGVWVQDTVSLTRRDAESGAEGLRMEARSGRSPAPPLLLDGDAAAVGVDRRGALVRWDTGTGERRWSVRTAAAPLAQSVNATPGSPSVSSAPALASGIIWFGADDGKLRGVRAGSGRVVWERDLGLPVTGGPAIAGHDLFVADLGGTLYAFEATGRR